MFLISFLFSSADAAGVAPKQTRAAPKQEYSFCPAPHIRQGDRGVADLNDTLRATDRTSCRFKVEVCEEYRPVEDDWGRSGLEPIQRIYLIPLATEIVDPLTRNRVKEIFASRASFVAHASLGSQEVFIVNRIYESHRPIDLALLERINASLLRESLPSGLFEVFGGVAFLMETDGSDEETLARAMALAMGIAGGVRIEPDVNILHSAVHLDDDRPTPDGEPSLPLMYWPDPECSEWNTPEFFLAHRTGDAIENCLASGPDIGIRDSVGNTWLHYAGLFNGTPEVVESLIAAGASVSVRNEFGMNPLHSAAHGSDSANVIDTLVAAGADLSARATLSFEDFGRTYYQRPEDICRYGTYHNTIENETPLHLAARYNRSTEVIAALVEAGADIEAQNKDGATPLARAVENGSDSGDIVGELLALGADVHTQDSTGKTPLHIAAAGNPNRQVIEVLLAAGADIQTRERLSGWTPLHTAARHNNAAVVEILLDAWITAEGDPNVKATDGHTPFDLVQLNSALKDTPVYWRLNEYRFP